MGVKQPKPLACFGGDDPIIPRTGAPLGIFEPPFGQNALGAQRVGNDMLAPPPAKTRRRHGTRGVLHRFGPPCEDRAFGALGPRATGV